MRHPFDVIDPEQIEAAVDGAVVLRLFDEQHERIGSIEQAQVRRWLAGMGRRTNAVKRIEVAVRDAMRPRSGQSPAEFRAEVGRFMAARPPAPAKPPAPPPSRSTWEIAAELLGPAELTTTGRPATTRATVERAIRRYGLRRR